MNRREFLKTALGATAAVVAPTALIAPEPRKRIWQVAAKLEGPKAPNYSRGVFYDQKTQVVALDIETDYHCGHRQERRNAATAISPGNYEAIAVPEGYDIHLYSAARDLGISYERAVQLQDTPELRAARALWKEWNFGRTFGMSGRAAIRLIEERGFTVHQKTLDALRRNLSRG